MAASIDARLALSSAPSAVTSESGENRWALPESRWARRWSDSPQAGKARPVVASSFTLQAGW